MLHGYVLVLSSFSPHGISQEHSDPGLGRGEQRSKVLPASQGEEEGQDDGETLQIHRAHNARGVASTIPNRQQIWHHRQCFILYSANICALFC